MTTTRHRPTWDLALDPLVSCKLCLGEYPLEQMTTVAQCQCVFCTLVGPCWRRHRVKGCRRVSLRLRFASPDRKPRPVPFPRAKGPLPPRPHPPGVPVGSRVGQAVPAGLRPRCSGVGGQRPAAGRGLEARGGPGEPAVRALAVWKETPRSSLWPHGARLASPERARPASGQLPRAGRQAGVRARAPRSRSDAPRRSQPHLGPSDCSERGRGTGRPAPSGPPPPRPGVVRAGEGGRAQVCVPSPLIFRAFLPVQGIQTNKGPEKGKKRTVFSFSSNYKKPKSLLHLSSQWTTCLACLVFKYLG